MAAAKMTQPLVYVSPDPAPARDKKQGQVRFSGSEAAGDTGTGKEAAVTAASDAEEKTAFRGEAGRTAEENR